MNLERYYIDLNKCLGEDFSEYEFDENGIPMSRFFRNSQWKHNPITVCQYGLHFFNKFIDEGQESDKNIFLAQADWLVRNAKPGPNDSLVWPYLFDLPFYGISAPWISGMAQGEALSVLLRAHSLTDDEKYLRDAIKVWNIFEVAVEDGGVMAKFPNGFPVIEEYPRFGNVIAVLNGFIFAIFGVYDFSSYTQKKESEKLFVNLIESLTANLEHYDAGYWSFYDLKSPKRLTSKAYHRLHLEQLKKLHEITGENIFGQSASQFQNYLDSSLCNLRWAARKLHQKLILRI